MNREKKKILRALLFRHLDGIAVCPTVSALQLGGINEFMIKHTHFTFQELLNKFKTNGGYLNVALRLLASQGWLQREIIKDGEEINFKLTNKGGIILHQAEYYVEFCQHLPILINIDQHLFNSNIPKIKTDFVNLIKKLSDINIEYNDKNKPGWEMAKHLEGLLIGPILVALGRSEFFTSYLERKDRIDDDILVDFPFMKPCLDFFTMLKWVENMRFTDKGQFFMSRTVAYGVTVSYLPTFLQIPELLFGNPNKIWKRTKEGLETHVNRGMNVWGSGGAHSLYFRKIDEIITHLFNQPLKDQPIGIADMGCGDGTLLKHLYNVVHHHTLRGKNLEKYPLRIIGADFNKAARLASTITLNEADIKFSILAGDISDPVSYSYSLQKQFGLDLRQMLNVRSFLDHNRIYSPPKKSFSNRICHSTGAFAFRGRWIPNNELKQNLVEHFSAWKDYVNKFGLLILELHTIDPILTAPNLGDTVATAYDGTHGYSDQYIFEVDTFLSSAMEAGLKTDPMYQAHFPNDELTTISINLFRSIN